MKISGNTDEIELIKLIDYSVPSNLPGYPSISLKIHYFEVESKFICNKFDIKSVEEFIDITKIGIMHKDKSLIKFHNDENHYLVKHSYKELKELIFNEKYKVKEIGFKYDKKDRNNKTNR